MIPSSSPRSTIAATSSLVTNLLPPSGRIDFKIWIGMMINARDLIIYRKINPVTGTSFFQYAVPRVFGTISEKNKTATVRMIEAPVRYSSPQIVCTCEPTPAAPIV